MKKVPSINGTRKVIEYLNDNNIKIDWCIVGEPSSDKQLGDVIRIGRRGSLNAILTIKGIQGHVAFPELAENPIHKASHFLADNHQLNGIKVMIRFQLLRFRYQI